MTLPVTPVLQGTAEINAHARFQLLIRVVLGPLLWPVLTANVVTYLSSAWFRSKGGGRFSPDSDVRCPPLSACIQRICGG